VVFSGDLAAKAVWSLRDCDTVVILGGHLRRGDPLLFAEEGRFDCTVREAENDVQLLDALMSELKSVGIEEIAPDRDIDNSVEILLPLAALRFPKEDSSGFVCRRTTRRESLVLHSQGLP